MSIREPARGDPPPGRSGVIRILHLEDQPKDVTLIRAALELDALDCQVHNVATRDAFVAALQKGGFDLILSDYALPTFDGLSALSIVRQVNSDVPFIFVSGMMGEDVAVDTLRNGATDYVLKQRLTRLGPAVKRALKETDERRTRIELEAQLRQSQKLEAIGQLAGGVAHDFNNVLTVIMGFAELIKLKLDPGHEAFPDAGEILTAAERAAALTGQLLAFSRQQVLEPRVVDLNAIVGNLDAMLRRLISEEIELIAIPAVSLGSVKADPGQLEMALVNLVVNARDAMPAGGRLTIASENVDLDDAWAGLHPDTKPGPHVMLAVSDTGCGMSAEVRARIFEPFFTTKERGRGTGLGLSTVHGIVKQSGGHIDVDSEPGRGSTFRIYLPQVEAAAETAPAAPPAGHDRAGTETILLVESDPVIRRVVHESLELRGYTVLDAARGGDAIAICEQAGTRIDLLLTDVEMPVMNGTELVRRVTAGRPEVRVLFISGNVDRARIDLHERGTATACLQKPFTPEALLRKVREVLDALPRAAGRASEAA